ncbi:MAG: hypothetical protein IJO88_01630 [Oscillospiraceae bacterium]|nr:hypothetical protein [Oscillospiraceae bacterium]
MIVSDLHTHILPHIDDGSPDVETSLAMLRLEAEQGVGHVALTPHFSARRDDPDRFLTVRERAMAELRAAMPADAGLPALCLGAEVSYFRGMSDCEALKDLCIEGTHYILIELPATRWDSQILRDLEELPSKQGLRPIVAHVERYLPAFSAGEVLRKLLERPLLLQANAGFFLRRRTAPMALRMLRQGQIHLLGSDCHDLTERPPELGKAAELICRRLGGDALSTIGELGQKILCPIPAHS